MPEPGLKIKSIRNNILPISVFYFVFIIGVLSYFEPLIQTFQKSLPIAILITVILAIVFILFTMHLISFVSQRYDFYSEHIVVRKLFNKYIILSYNDILEVKKERSLLQAFTFLLTYSVKIGLKDGSSYCFGPVQEVNEFVELLEKN